MSVYNNHKQQDIEFEEWRTSPRGQEFNVPSREYTDLIMAGDGFISYMRTCYGPQNVMSALNYVKLKNPDPNRYVLDMTYRHNTGKGSKHVEFTSLMNYLDQVATEHFYQKIQNGVAIVALGDNSERILRHTVPTSQKVLENNFGVKLAPEFCKTDQDFNNRSLHSTANEYIMQAFNMARAGKDQVEVSQDEKNPNKVVITLQDPSKAQAILAAFYETMPTVQEYFYTYTTKTGNKELVYGVIFERKGVRIDCSYNNLSLHETNVSLSFSQ